MYDLDYARYFWRILFQMDQVMKKFRGRFCEKASSVYFFWDSFDMAIRLSSGHTEPGMEGAYHVQLSAAYDHPSLRVYIFPYEVIRAASDCFF